MQIKTSISIVCYKHKVLADGTSPLMLRLSKDGKRTMKSLGISLHTKHWNFTKNQPKPNCPNRELIRQLILKVEMEYNGKILDKAIRKEEFTSQSLIHEDKQDIKAQTVEEFYITLIQELRDKGQIGTSYAYLNSYKALQNFNNQKKLHFTFSHIDVAFLKKFEDWMRSKGNKDTTLSYQLRTLRATFNRAIEAKIVAKDKNPFSDYSLSKLNTKTQKRALSKDEILKIINADCGRASRIRSLTHDIFSFSYLCAGISFVDIANLTAGNIVDGRLLYKRQKTHGQINLVLSDKALIIISKYDSYQQSAEYLFPILHSKRHITPMQKSNRVHKICHQINVELRAFTKELGITAEVTTYVARHTFATVLKRSGVNIAIISESLGHSDLATTQIYLDSFENSQIDEAMKNLL